MGRLDVAGGDVFDFKWRDIRHAENRASGGIRAEFRVQFAQEFFVAVKTLGDEFPRRAVGEEGSEKEFLVGRGRSWGGLGVRGLDGGGFGRGDEIEILHAQGVVGESFCSGGNRLCNDRRVVEGFAPRGLVEVKHAAENRIGLVGNRAGRKPLIVQKHPQQQNLVDRSRWRGGLVGFFCAGIAKGESFLGVGNPELLTDLEEVALESVEFAELGDGEVEPLGDAHEDIAFFDRVNSRVGFEGFRCVILGVGEDLDALWREAPRLAGRGGNDRPFPIHRALQTGLGTCLQSEQGTAACEESDGFA